jgi:hypothetical protein
MFGNLLLVIIWLLALGYWAFIFLNGGFNEEGEV